MTARRGRCAIPADRTGCTKGRPLPVLREAGFALLGFALWIFVVLAPLHQSARALIEFRAAGALPANAWVLCQQEAEDGGPGLPAAFKCPLSPAAQALDTAGKPTVLRPVPTLALVSLTAAADAGRATLRRTGNTQPRGPPAGKV